MGGDAELEVTGLAVQLAGRPVLHDVNLRLTAGELVGLIGPNGAGKTTLLRTILGVVPFRTGDVLIGGRSPDRARGTIGYVPQRHEFAWDFPISVEKAVMTGRVHRIGWLRRPRQADRRATDAAIERVGLDHLRTGPIGELSGGQRQRVLVARALALEPRMLLLDEPFTGLDIPTQTVLTDLFAALREEGRTLLMTTHDISAAKSACTRLCLLNRTVVADGTAEELRDPALWLRAFGVTAPEQVLADPVPVALSEPEKAGA